MTTYTNRGPHLKTPTAEENHTISLTDTADYENQSGVVTVEYDGTTIITETYETLEMTTESPDPVIIPILFGSGTMEVQPGVEATQNYGYILYIGYMPYKDEHDYSIYGMHGFATLISYTEIIVGGQTVQSMANGGSISEPYDITIEGDTFTTSEFGGNMIPGVQIHICDDSDLVYADNPVFSADSNVMMAYSGYVYRYENPSDWDEYGLYATYEGKIDEMDANNLTYTYLSDSSSNITSLSDPVIATSDYSGALRLDSITMTALFEDDSERTFTTKGLIVPKEVQLDGSDPDPDPDVPGNTAKNVSHSTYVGWSAFRKAQLSDAEISDGAVDLTDAFGKNTTVSEVLAVQGGSYAAFDFDPKTQKLALYTATNTPASGTATVTILVLVS